MLATLPGISTTCGYTADGLPIGMSIIGKRFDEQTGGGGGKYNVRQLKNFIVFFDDLLLERQRLFVVRVKIAAADVPDFTAKLGQPVKGMKIAMPKEFFSDDIDNDVKSAVEKAAKSLEALDLSGRESLRTRQARSGTLCRRWA